MQAVIVVGCILGYAVLGWVASIVLAAIDTENNSRGPDMSFVIIGAVVWPVSLVVGLLIGLGYLLAPAAKLTTPFWRMVGRSWKKNVKKLNPRYHNFEDIL